FDAGRDIAGIGTPGGGGNSVLGRIAAQSQQRLGALWSGAGVASAEERRQSRADRRPLPQGMGKGGYPAERIALWLHRGSAGCRRELAWWLAQQRRRASA